MKEEDVLKAGIEALVARAQSGKRPGPDQSAPFVVFKTSQPPVYVQFCTAPGLLLDIPSGKLSRVDWENLRDGVFGDRNKVEYTCGGMPIFGVPCDGVDDAVDMALRMLGYFVVDITSVKTEESKS